MRVAVIGVGYVGLVQAAVLADVGNIVTCVDINEARINNLRQGIVGIYEPDLENLVLKNVRDLHLHFTSDITEALSDCEIIFIAVGTPPGEDGSADLRHVLTVADAIGQHMSAPKIIVNKSTVPVGTAEKVQNQIAQALRRRNLTIAFEVVSNPEFLKEGCAVSDCMRPERIILGVENPNGAACELLKELYAPFNRNHDKLIVMDVRSAELTKYAANCMLATKISFMNEMANLAELVGADIEMVRKGIGSDSRIGYQFIYPGCGYGGSCFPKDVKALIHTGEQQEYPLQLLQAVDSVNEKQKTKLFNYLQQAFNGNLAGKTCAIWGLAFKPNTDDMREASSLVLIAQLIAAGAQVQAFDPKAMGEAQKIIGAQSAVRLTTTKEAALQGADALIICTEWQQFRSPDFEQIKQLLSAPIIIDGRNLYDPARMKKRGFIYYAIGRGDSIHRPHNNPPISS
jgi:UDPglucose 6-dehydrogenase